MKLDFSLQNFEKYSDLKFNENQSMVIELFYADRQTDRQTDMTKLILAFRKFCDRT